jgi:hypothetical protein
MTFTDKIKQKIWNLVYRFFPTLQKVLLKLHILSHTGRQKYHIGWLAPDKTLEELKKHLHYKLGFGNHFIAWEDDGQVLSWRKLMNFQDQYHLRVFCDGEIRGHFELTPEAHPIAHFKGKGEEERNADFLIFLGDFAVKEKYISNLKVDTDVYDPKSQITIENYKIYKTLFRF